MVLRKCPREAPARPQTVAVDVVRATADLRGTVWGNWQWDLAGPFSQEISLAARPISMVMPLSLPLPTAVLIPSVTPETTGTINADLYRSLMRDAHIHGSSDLTSFDANARGPVFSLPGGEALLAAGAATGRIAPKRLYQSRFRSTRQHHQHSHQ